VEGYQGESLLTFSPRIIHKSSFSYSREGELQILSSTSHPCYYPAPVLSPSWCNLKVPWEANIVEA
jgi:hypothetical protein